MDHRILTAMLVVDLSLQSTQGLTKLLYQLADLVQPSTGELGDRTSGQLQLSDVVGEICLILDTRGQNDGICLSDTVSETCSSYLTYWQFCTRIELQLQYD